MKKGSLIPSITRFEDIEAWQKGLDLARRVYDVSAREPLSRDFGLRDQMRRASVSVISNIAEGFERGGDKEFRQFLSLAKGSTGELRAQLYIARDAGLVDEDQFQELHALATETARLLSGFMRYLGNSKVGGTKYKM